MTGSAGAGSDIRPGAAPTQLRIDIQALRGVAVLAVVLYHCRILLPGGFVGVDVFFVISGFVIGRGLLGQLRSGNGIDTRDFYLRRAHRLLPALATMLCIVVVLAPYLGPVGAAEVTPRTAVAAGFFSANAYLFRVAPDGYFDAAVGLNPLLHTWSLSLEEQLYLVVPLIAAAAWASGRRRRRSFQHLLATVLVLAVGSFALSAVLVSLTGPAADTASRFAFFSPFTRAWEFAAGLALVLAPSPTGLSRSVRRAVLALGAVMITAAAVLYSDTTPFPGLAAAVPVLGTMLVILGGTDPAGTTPSALAKLGPLVRIGDVSYGWYLWHWPLIVFAAAAWPQAGSLPRVAAAAAALGPAWWSHRHLERPLDRATSAPTGRSVALLAGCIAAPFLTVLITAPLTAAEQRRAADEWFAQAHQPHADEAGGCSSDEPLGDRDPMSCRWGDPDGSREVVLIGDSNAGHFSEALIGAVASSGDRLRITTANACPFIDARTDMTRGSGSTESCQRFVQGSLDDLLAHPPDVVVIANATDLYVFDDDVTLVGPTGDEAQTVAEKERVFEKALQRVVARLRDAGTEVIVVNVVPKPWAAGVDLDSRGCSGLLLRLAPQKCAMPTYRSDNTVTAVSVAIESRAARAEGATSWSFNEDLCPDSTCTERAGALVVWSESFHLSVAASERLAGRAAHLLDRAR